MNLRKIIIDAWFRSILGKYIPFKIGIPLLRVGNIKNMQIRIAQKNI